MSKRIKRAGRKALIQLSSEKPAPNFDFINVLLMTLFIGSLTMTCWEVKIYQTTFIPFKIPFFIWISTGLIFLPILKKYLIVYLDLTNILLRMVYSLVTCGGLLVSAFMLSNYYLADTETFVVNEQIISTGHMGTSSRGQCPEGYIIIEHDNQEKQLVYFCDTPVEKYKSVDLTISKGLFGFEIITHSDFKMD